MYSYTNVTKLHVVLFLLVLVLGNRLAYANSPSKETTAASCPKTQQNNTDLITEYSIPTAKSDPTGITAGPDGALWFGEGNGMNIGRITTDGKFTEYPFQVAHSDQHFLAPGPDGAVWFTDDWQNKIGFISADGKITEYPIPTGIKDTDDNGAAFTTSYPRGLVTGADKALWFTENSGNNIGRITTDGKVAEYPLPTADSGPVGLALGSDGAVWFVEKNANQIGRITTDGKITEYKVPTPASQLLRITAGPDAALWFTEFNGNNIGRITTDGKINEYPLPTGAGPVGIATLPDSTVWFTEYKANKIGCITMAGNIAEYPIPTTESVPFSIVAGSDGALWFTENAGSKIGRLQTQIAPTASLGEHVVAEWKINNPEGIVFGFDSAWVPSRRNPNVTTRIDRASNKIIEVIKETGYLAKSAVVTSDAVWVAGQSSDLAAIDPKTNTIGVKVPGNHPQITYGFNSIWAVGHQGEPLDRIDPATSTITASIPLGTTVTDSGEENSVFVTASAVWVISWNGELAKIDPTTNSVVLRTTFDKVIKEAKAQTTVPNGKGTDFIWLNRDGLIRIDAKTGVGLTYLPMSHDQLGAPTATDESVWLGGNGQITRVNAATNRIDATYKVAPGRAHVEIGFGSIWLWYEDVGLVQRLDVVP